MHSFHQTTGTRHSKTTGMLTRQQGALAQLVLRITEINITNHKNGVCVCVRMCGCVSLCGCEHVRMCGVHIHTCTLSIMSLQYAVIAMCIFWIWSRAS